jgi:hypothetical protein
MYVLCSELSWGLAARERKRRRKATCKYLSGRAETEGACTFAPSQKLEKEKRVASSLLNERSRKEGTCTFAPKREIKKEAGL